MQKNKTRLILLSVILSAFMALCVWVALDTTKFYLLTVFAFLVCICYTLRKLEDHIFFFCFLLCFFTFLLGGHVLNKVTQVYGWAFSNEIEFHADLVLMISLLGILLGYILIDKLVHKNEKAKSVVDHRSKSNTLLLRKMGKILFFCCYPFWMVLLIEIIVFVAQNGYTDYYIAYSSNIPAIFRLLGAMAPVFFFIFLATMPSKKESIFPLALYIVYAVASLGTGRRLTFITSLLIVFAYLMLRNKVNRGVKPWLPKKFLLIICVAAPILLMLMYLFEYIRSDFQVGDATQYFPLLGFFIRQGTSINVIKYTQLFASKLNSGAFYSLYSTLKWLSDSFLETLFGFDIPFAFGRQSEHVAIYGTNLADFVSYNANPGKYLSGIGYGSCYVEELFVDFGYIGVLIGSVIYGVVLCYLFKKAPQRNNIWLTAMGLYIADVLFTAPRASYDAFFAKLLYTEFWAPVLLLVIVTKNKWLKNKMSILFSTVDRVVFQKFEDKMVDLIDTAQEGIRRKLSRNGK